MHNRIRRDRYRSHLRAQCERLENRQLLSASYAITGLTIPGGFYTSTYASAINDSGQVVGQAIGDGGIIDAPFLYSHGATTINGGSYLSAIDINNAGQVLGGEILAFSSNELYLVDHGTEVDLVSDAVGRAINNNGEVVGNTYYGPDALLAPTNAFTYFNGIVTDLDTQTGISNLVATNLNDSGDVVGFAGTGSNLPDSRPVLIHNGTATYLDTALGATGGGATAISDNGIIVGRLYHGSVGEGFIDQDGVATDLGVLSGSTGTYPGHVNDAGEVVGDASLSADETHAFIYSDGVLSDLNDLIAPNSGWVLTDATGINASGDICGDGVFNGQAEAFLLAPLPAAAPTANPDVYLVNASKTFTVGTLAGVLANDTDPNDLPMTDSLVSGSTGLGTLSFDTNGDGGFTYVPNPGSVTGLDSFTYSAGNSAGSASAPTTVELELVYTYENTPPTARGTFANIYRTGGQTYRLNVTFSDNVSINPATIQDGSIYVSGPHGFFEYAALRSLPAGLYPQTVIAPFNIAPPGGVWTAADNGVYKVWIKKNHVADSSNNFISGGVLGTFTVDIATPKKSHAANVHRLSSQASALMPAFASLSPADELDWLKDHSAVLNQD